MWFLHGLPRRRSGVRVPCRRRSGAGPRCGHGGGPRRWRRARPGAAGVRRCRRRAVRVLHTRLGGGHARPSGHGSRYIVVEDQLILAVGAGTVPAVLQADRVIDGSGCLATPGLVNTHHHLYQWATRGLAQEEKLFGWLAELYPVWAGLDAEIVGDVAAAGLGWLARTGCTTTTDHHYVFPREGGDVLEAEISAARRLGVRFHPCRGSMDLGASAGVLPPDSVVEDRDAALAATAEA